MSSKICKNPYLNSFFLGILAGIAIGVGGTLFLLFLSINQKFLGAVSFCVGLLTICYLGLHLYTGKIGYVLENNKKFIFFLLIIYIGNIVGATAMGYLIGLTLLKDTVISVCQNKLIAINGGTGQSIAHMLGMSFFCGNFVFLAVDIFKKNKNHFIKVLGILICITGFVMLNNEHCVANMFYFAVGNIYQTDALAAILSILIATIGNSIGSIVLYLVINNSQFRKYL